AAAARAAAAPQGAPSFRALLAHPRAVALPAREISSMPAGDARGAGERMMDAVLGAAPIAATGDAEALAPSAAPRSFLSPAALRGSIARPSVPANAAAEPAGRTSTAARAAKSLGLMAAGGLAVYGLPLAAAAVLPSVFGLVPAAAVWAVSSGAVLLPISLYERYRLGLRDSPRLTGVKTMFDLALGAFLGAVAVAVPAVATGALLSTPMVALASVGGLSFAAAAATRETGWLSNILNAVGALGALNLIAPIMGHVAAAPLTLAGLGGLAALPVITTVAFFAGRVMAAAESGRPFAVPGSAQAIRFPEYTWVMTGVVFALLTGYSPVWTNAAFGAWMFLGKTRLFNYLFGAAAAWAAFTGFGAPVSFLVIAFAPERAAKLAEWLLGRLLPAGRAAPSTKPAPSDLAPRAEAGRWPRYRFWAKTALAFASLVALGAVMSATVFTLHAVLKDVLIAGGLSLIPFLFSKKLIKLTTKATPMDERQDPEVYGIMRDLRERINKARAVKGEKPIPMPEMVNVPMPVPNAFATGRSPFNAMVGVTLPMKELTLNPEVTRAGLIRLMYVSDPASKQFAVFRMGIRGSIAGVAPDAGPQALIQALQKADAASIKALGVRMLRGVMGHEFNHVMHRDMLISAGVGTVSSAISFASYGVLWTAGHAQALFTRFWERLSGRGRPAGPGPRVLAKGPL
ncbi:MAG: M48 family metalloprotease, partial [Elusimicrobia bacterium]|nr:M48 family metalloprotease [Elusimicrobiota bacterium]